MYCIIPYVSECQSDLIASKSVFEVTLNPLCLESRLYQKRTEWTWIFKKKSITRSLGLNCVNRGNSRERIAIRENELCKSRERISNPRERTPNPRKRFAQLVTMIHFCFIFFFIFFFLNPHVPSGLFTVLRA